jgi:hypothetical protein
MGKPETEDGKKPSQENVKGVAGRVRDAQNAAAGYVFTCIPKG